MPGSTMHLMFARLIEGEPSDEFLVGSIALDAVEDYHEKDKTHFRKIPDRPRKIAEFARTLAPTDFNRGLISHLYLDWRWDGCELNRFIDEYGGIDSGWFVPYRRSLGRVCHTISRMDKDVHSLWHRVGAADIALYGDVPGTGVDEAFAFVQHTYNTCFDDRGEPDFFYPDDVRLFLEMAAGEYERFLGRYNIRR